MHEANTILDEALRGALLELLECYGQDTSTGVQAISRAAPPRTALAASLGFTAEVLRGTLVLIAPEATIARALPPELSQGDVTPDRLTDWAAELSNQLVGRIKNKLLRYRVAVTISVPSVLSAENLRCLPRIPSVPIGATSVKLTTRMADFEAWFDVEVQPGIDFSQRHSVAPPDEGELVFL